MSRMESLVREMNVCTEEKKDKNKAFLCVSIVLRILCLKILKIGIIL